MRYSIQNIYIQITAFIIFMLVLSGCATAAAEQPTETPTAFSQPTESSIQAALTANETNVSVFNEQNPEKALGKFETVSIPVGERIQLDKQGRGVLRFGDRNEVDLFGDTEIYLDDLKLEPGGSTFARLKQVSGHINLKLNDQTVARVTLETDDSTITTLEQGTEFAVCFAPGKLTCIEVSAGAVEVISQGIKLPLRAGEATYYTPGQPPPPPICARADEFNEWLIMKRGPGEVQTLGQLVQSWPQEPCGNTIQATATAVDMEATSPPPEATLPPVETATPTLLPTSTVPAGIPYVRINNIIIDEQNRYVVEYETFEYTEQLPGMHVHFFFNTVPPDQAGVPGQGPWILYGGPRPFTEYGVSDRPPQATQMCALVANSDHSVQPNSGNCLDLPESPTG